MDCIAHHRSDMISMHPFAHFGFTRAFSKFKTTTLNQMSLTEFAKTPTNDQEPQAPNHPPTHTMLVCTY